MSYSDTYFKILEILPHDEAEELRRWALKCEDPFLEGDKEALLYYHLAQNPKTSSEVLAILATSESEHIREWVAHNRNTPPEALAQLAHDVHAEIRLEVAWNPSTSSETLEQLSDDQDEDIIIAVLCNENTSKKVRIKLSFDESGNAIQSRIQIPIDTFEKSSAIYSNFIRMIESFNCTSE